MNEIKYWLLTTHRQATRNDHIETLRTITRREKMQRFNWHRDGISNITKLR